MERSAILHLGWDADWESALDDAGVAGVPGRITRVERGESDVATERGLLRVLSDSTRSQSAVAPVTGDWVAVADLDGSPIVEVVLPRRTALVRRDPGEREEYQPLAANVDAVFLAHGHDRPFREGKLERFLVLAWNSGATPVVILTKSDLAASGETAELEAVVSAVAPEVEVVVTSTESGEGLERIAELLDGAKTGAILGESGAGKSTLVNALIGDDIQETGHVRKGDAKGRHTTITRDLLVLSGGGLLIDTPGVRAVGLWDAHDALARVFADIVDAAASCRFNDCAHDGEPGCAVRAAVDDGRIDPRRLERHRLMAAELAESDRRQVERERGRNRKGAPKGRGRRR